MRKKNFLLCICILLAFTGCSNNDKAQSKEALTVITQKVDTSSITQPRTYVGTVTAGTQSAISFATMGTVAKVFVEEGDQVQKNQPLAELNKTNAQNLHTIAVSTLKQAEDAYQRLHKLYQKGSLPEIQYIEVKTKLAQAKASEAIAQKTLNDCILRAPTSGYISRRSVDVGNNVNPAVSSFEIIKIDDIEVKIAVPENEIAQLKKGEQVSFVVSALNNQSFTGTIKEKGVLAHPLSHTYTVKIGLHNRQHLLLPGMVCNVTIHKVSAGSTLVIPQQAIVVGENGQRFVWLFQNNKAIKKEVTIGDVYPQGIAITQGLHRGDEIIIEGQNKISEGQKIKRL